MIKTALTLALLTVQQSSNHVFGFTAPKPTTSVTTHNAKVASLSSSQRNFLAKAPFTFGSTASSLGISLPFGNNEKTADGQVEPNSLKGKTMVVIGGSSGMGFASVKGLAKGGATVVFTSRTKEKGEKSVQKVKDFLKETHNEENDNIYAVELDLDDLDNIKSFPQRLQDTLGKSGSEDLKIDVLMNNAGVFGIPERQLTKNGFERTFQSNYLGQFVLTAVLKPYLRDNARIVNVSSSGHVIPLIRGGRVLDNLNSEKQYDGTLAYGQSQLCKVLFTQELQRRATEAGLKWSVNCLHPGVVDTDIVRYMLGGDDNWLAQTNRGLYEAWENTVKGIMGALLLKPEEGAGTQVYLATSEAGEEKGKYFSDFESRDLLPFATDENKAKELWEISEKFGGIKFEL